MVNILDLLKGQLGSAAVGQIAELIGENNSNTSSAINSILPSLLGGLMQKGSTTEGASGILDMLTKDKHDGSMFDNLSGLLGGGSKTSALMNIGSIALPFILGGKKAGFMNLLGKATGFGGTSSSSLTNLLLPMILGMVGKQVKKSGLNASGLMDLLGGQKEAVSSQLPEGMGDLLGFSKSTGPVKTTSNATKTTTTRTVTEEKSSGGLMKWLLPLALILGAGWFLTRGCGGDVANTVDNTVNTTTQAATEVVEGAKSTMNYTVDGSGNLVDEAGTVIKKAGEFSKDASGKIMDASGNAIQSIESKTTQVVSEGKETMEKMDAAGGEMKKMKLTLDDAGNLVNGAGEIQYKAGDFKEVDGYYVDGNGNKIGRVWDKIKKAVGDAAEKTADFFKGSFGKMFKKEAGASSTYTLGNMAFDPESHRLTNFSKSEFEGLVAALKANPDSKISVQVHTNDGASDKENKNLTKLRADQIELMMETLGVGKKQVSSKGMGSSDAAKAAADAIEIVVE